MSNLKYKSIFITNPWGILEEKKLNYLLIKNWLNNKTPKITFPNYIRDNILIDDLSNAYYKILNSNSKKINYFPSGYCSSNEVFISALKNKFEKFFKKKVNVNFVYDVPHKQPIKRINGKRVLKKIIFRKNLNKYFKYYKTIFRLGRL